MWKRTKDGKEPNEIAEELDVSTYNFVWGYRSYIRAIEAGELPKSTTTARDCASALRGFSKRHYKKKILSQATYSRIQDYVTDCEQIQSDHLRNRQRGAGKEWFLTHLKFLDATAGLLNLKTQFERLDLATSA